MSLLHSARSLHNFQLISSKIDHLKTSISNLLTDCKSSKLNMCRTQIKWNTCQHTFYSNATFRSKQKCQNHHGNGWEELVDCNDIVDTVLFSGICGMCYADRNTNEMHHDTSQNEIIEDSYQHTEVMSMPEVTTLVQKPDKRQFLMSRNQLLRRSTPNLSNIMNVTLANEGKSKSTQGVIPTVIKSKRVSSMLDPVKDLEKQLREKFDQDRLDFRLKMRNEHGEIIPLSRRISEDDDDSLIDFHEWIKRSSKQNQKDMAKKQALIKSETEIPLINWVKKAKLNFKKDSSQKEKERAYNIYSETISRTRFRGQEYELSNKRPKPIKPTQYEEWLDKMAAEHKESVDEFNKDIDIIAALNQPSETGNSSQNAPGSSLLSPPAPQFMQDHLTSSTTLVTTTTQPNPFRSQTLEIQQASRHLSEDNRSVIQIESGEDEIPFIERWLQNSYIERHQNPQRESDVFSAETFDTFHSSSEENESTTTSIYVREPRHDIFAH